MTNIQNIQPNNQVHHIIQQHVGFGAQNIGNSIPIIGSSYVYNPNISIQTIQANPMGTPNYANVNPAHPSTQKIQNPNMMK